MQEPKPSAGVKSGVPILAVFGLVIVFIYLALGNIPRMVSVPGFRDNILITEFMLYSLFLVLVLACGLLGKVFYRNSYLILLIMFSAIVGVIGYGFALKPVLYAARLSLLLISSISAGYLMYYFYSGDMTKIARFFIIAYLSVFGIGVIIFVAFPNLANLWSFLRRFGIAFYGDPHIRRFVSSYFDPNYYSVIAIIPVFLSFYLYRETYKGRYFFFALLFLLSIVLSVSRSGIATLMIFMAVLAVKWVVEFTKRYTFKRATLLYSSLALLFAVGLYPFINQVIFRGWSRISQTSLTDSSTSHRWDSFREGWDIFTQKPFFGLGYNYYVEVYPSYLSSVDSSLLSSLINFGLIITFIFISLFLYWQWKNHRIMRFYGANPHVKNLFEHFLVYLWLVVIFASQFNNVLFYQFWLFPVMVLGTCFTLYAENLKQLQGDGHESGN